MKKLLMGALVSLLLCTTACSNQQSTAKEEEKEATPARISVYLSGPEAMISKLEEEFEQEHGDVLDLTILSCGQLRTKVYTESEASEIQADVFWGSDPIVYNKLQAKGALEKITLTHPEAIKEEYVVADKDYVLVSERYITVMYNTDLVTTTPTSYQDLLNAEYQDKITMADASQSATAFAIASSLYQLDNQQMDLFSGLKENGIKLNKSNGLVPTSIIDGQFALGIAPHDAYVRLSNKAKKEGYEIPVAISFPQDETIAISRPIAISKQSDRTEEELLLANEFVNFVLSAKAQKIMNNFGFVSVLKNMENKYLPENVTVYRPDFTQAANDEEVLLDAYTKIFHN